jgi:ketosteroid isomerase-like protein
MNDIRSTALRWFLFASCCALPAGPAWAAHDTTAIRETDSAAIRLIKRYFNGWERRDWEAVASQLAADFTFSSPAPDDHLPTERFKAKCWSQTDWIRRFEFPKILGDEHEALAIVHVVTTDNRVIRNIEYFTFRDGKVASIEVFFGGGGQGYPSNVR